MSLGPHKQGLSPVKTPACLPAAQGTVAASGRRVWAALATPAADGPVPSMHGVAGHPAAGGGSGLTAPRVLGSSGGEEPFLEFSFGTFASTPHFREYERPRFAFVLSGARGAAATRLGEFRSGEASAPTVAARATPWLWSRAAQGRGRPWGSPPDPAHSPLPPVSAPNSGPWKERQAARWERAGGHGDSSRVPVAGAAQCRPGSGWASLPAPRPGQAPRGREGPSGEPAPGVAVAEVCERPRHAVLQLTTDSSCHFLYPSHAVTLISLL